MTQGGHRHRRLVVVVVVVVGGNDVDDAMMTARENSFTKSFQWDAPLFSAALLGRVQATPAHTSCALCTAHTHVFAVAHMLPRFWNGGRHFWRMPECLILIDAKPSIH